MEEKTVLSGPLFSAAEIAMLAIPGLPASKPGVLARARSEGWPYEEKTGVGGTKRMYQLPAKYMREVEHAAPPATPSPVAGTIVRGSGKVDLSKLELAMTALTNWEQKRSVEIDAARRPALLALLYDYLVLHDQDEGAEAMDRVLRALG